MTPRIRRRSGRGRSSGFTLTEVLAALVFMAIVLPVAVEGLRLASLAGQVGTQKEVAARIGERVLNELMLSGGTLGSGQQGVVREGVRDYTWNVTRTSWTVDAMELVTVQVVFQVQGRRYDVQMSTLAGGSSL